MHHAQQFVVSTASRGCSITSAIIQSIYTFFLYKNTIYKNVQAEIPEKNKNIDENLRSLNFGWNFFFLFESKSIFAKTSSYILFNFTSYCNLGKDF